MQRLGEGVTRLHLDLHVADPQRSAQVAVDLGAQVINAASPSHLVLQSPAGSVFCLVPSFGFQVPPAAAWPQGHHSRVAQLCWDVPVAQYDDELAFWRALMGGTWKTRAGEEPLATRMVGATALELRLQPSVLATQASSHLHLNTENRPLEVERLVALGAVKRVERSSWTLLEAVGGMAICVVDDATMGRNSR